MYILINQKYFKIAQIISEWASIATITIGVVVLIGWFFDISMLKTFGTDFSNMKTNAAICGALVGISFFIRQQKRSTSKNIFLSKILASVVIIIAILTFFEYFFNINLGIDQLLFNEDINSLYTSNPNRMSPLASLGFLLSGIFIFTTNKPSKCALVVSQMLILCVGLLSSFSFVNYLFGSPFFFIEITKYTNIALGAVFSLFLLFISGFLLLIDKGYFAVLISAELAGKVARRLCIITPIMFIAIDVIVLALSNFGMLNTKYVPSIQAILEISFLIYLIVRVSISLSKSENEKNILIHELTNKEIELQQRHDKIEAQNEEILSHNQEYQALHDELLAQNEEYRALNEEMKNVTVLLTNAYTETNNLKTNLEIIVDQRTEQLTLSEIRYRTLFEKAIDGICYLSVSGNIIKANQSFASIHGYTVEEIQAINIKQLDTPENLNLNAERMTKLLAGESLNFEVEHYHKNGSVIQLEANASLITINNEKVIVSFHRDISERKKIQAELQNNQDFLNETGKLAKVGGWELDLIAGKLFWTEEVYLIHETELGFVPNLENALNFYSDESKPIIEKAVQDAIEKAEAFNLELNVITAKNNYLWVHAIGKPCVKFGKVFKVSGAFQDITEKKNIQLALIRKNHDIEAQNEEYATLNEELIVTNEQLLEARQKAEESDRLKTAFLANMSHEIRTPLNGIVGFTQLLTKNSTTENIQKEYRKLFTGCSDQLLTIIDDLIDISKIEAGLISIQDQVVDLNDLMHDLLTLLQPKALQKNIDLKLNIDKTDENNLVITDGLRLRQILINLLNNALKFTIEGSVEYGYWIENNAIHFSVKDSGIGIDKSKHNIIFERFRQAEMNTAQNFGGNGLGLSISKSLVQLLGGDIYVESEIDKGATFIFNIELKRYQKRNSEQETQISVIVEPDFSDKTILVVEDELLNFMFIQDVMSEINITNCIHAKNGKQALEILINNTDIDLILMDLKMPDMDGFEITLHIRKLNKIIPIIAQSAYAQQSDKDKALACGCNAYITKPINIEIFMTTIKKYLI